MKKAAVLFLVLAACGGGATKTSGDSAMNSYCIHAASMTDALSAQSKGTATKAETVKSLASAQKNIANDAAAEDSEHHASLASSMRAVSDAVGQAKVAIDSDAEPDLQAVLDAADKLPKCP